MEGAGTGGPNLEPRVEQLESNVKSLIESQREIHKDNREMKAGLAGIAVRQQSQDAILQDIANKLDQQRTRRPELSSIAGVVSVLLVVWGLSLTPIYWRIDRMFETLDNLSKVQSTNMGIVAEYKADRIHINEELGRIKTWQDATLMNRYTKEDGHRLEDKLDRHIEDAARKGLE